MPQKARWSPWLACCVLCLLRSAHGARVLGVFAHYVRSNQMFNNAVMTSLAEAGHEVTVYSAHPPARQHPNFTHVPVRFQKDGEEMTYDDFIARLGLRSGYAGRIMRKIAIDKCDRFLSNPAVRALLLSDLRFDLVFAEVSWGEESLAVFAHKFQAPIVNLMPSGPWSVVNWWAGAPLAVAFAPDYLAFPYTDRMDLWERALNALSTLGGILANHWYDLPGHDLLVARHGGHLRPPAPPLARLLADRVALTFVNVHPTVPYPRPWTANMVPVGGVHIDDTPPPLPKAIDDFMSSSAEGVVFCSLGSLVPVNTMPLSLIESFLSVFERLPQRVVWKMSRDRLTRVPPNVWVSDWLPQQAVLAHPRLALFVTHGGLNSQLEAFHAGVPVVGVPFFSDQPHNVRLYEHLGVGVRLELLELDERTLGDAVRTVLTNDSFKINARKISQIVREQPMRPEEAVVYWSEYLLRHGGAPHLNPAAAALPWHQRFLVDIVVTTLLAAVLLTSLAWQLLKTVRRWLGSKRARTKKKLG